METLPHLTAKSVVGVGSFLLALVASWATMRTPGFPDGRTLTSWPRVLLGRLRDELPRGDRLTLGWVAIAAWSVLVSVLHFGGVYYNVYTALPWWDLLTHAMGGLGVAAVLAFTFRDATLHSPLWLVAAVLAIGAGFEVYEFVFKTFWYHWTLEFYVVDTVLDLIVNTSGAALFAGAALLYRNRIETGSVSDRREDESVGADSD
ncbi:hypothetical protein [Halobellus captivus]|uniref:hypothetical protein n=1 Tax=Halobellus captivus TaxID=2592614 RepID=UPI0011A8B083|nr:hypothetical protein [Halobellus captivus]